MSETKQAAVGPMPDAYYEARKRSFEMRAKIFALTEGRALKLQHRMTRPQVRAEVFRFFDELFSRNQYKSMRPVVRLMAESGIFLLANVPLKLRDAYIGMHGGYFYWITPRDY